MAYPSHMYSYLRDKYGSAKSVVEEMPQLSRQPKVKMALLQIEQAERTIREIAEQLADQEPEEGDL